MQTSAVSLAPAAAPGTEGASSTTAPGSAPDGAPLGDLLKNAIGGVDDLENQAAGAVGGMLQGTGVDIHDAMIATEKANMAFELTLAVRNKAVAAYQQVMGMQF